MARRTLEQAIELGILSTGHLSSVTTLSKTHIQTLCNQGKINSFTIAGGRERRINADDELVEFIRSINVPISEKLLAANRSFNSRSPLPPQPEPAIPPPLPKMPPRQPPPPPPPPPPPCPPKMNSPPARSNFTAKRKQRSASANQDSRPIPPTPKTT